jgi:broad specificity phosphatase PhoE
MALMKEMYIIRHGETELNRLGIVQGRGVNADLNAKGRVQSQAFFDHYKNVPFDKIYTSSLIRTHQTVKGFIDKSIAWQQLPELDELAWGVWEGKPNNEEARAAFRTLTRDWELGNHDAKFENGESPNEVATRLAKAIEIIKSHPDESKVLVCMHGRALRIIMCLLTGKPLTEMDTFLHANTTLYRVNYDEGKFTLIESNNTLHLAELNEIE